MILLDTNVVSELMRPKPDPAVVAWFDTRVGLPLYISTITEAELWSGVDRMPAGKRRLVLQSLITDMLDEDFAGRILAFDRAAARLYGHISARRADLGKPVSTADGQIAAIAKANGLKIATRNIKDFADCDVALVNPWSAKAGQIGFD
jgi:toxin FitB